jgi:hypothetical protein
MPNKHELGYFGNIWVRQNTLNPNEVMRGHQHKFDHVSLLVSGVAEVCIEGEAPKTFHAPTFIVIRKDKNHIFKAVGGPVTWYCVFALRDINGEVVTDMFSSENDPMSAGRVDDGYWASDDDINKLDSATTEEVSEVQ